MKYRSLDRKKVVLGARDSLNIKIMKHFDLITEQIQHNLILNQLLSKKYKPTKSNTTTISLNMK